jgi:lysozyme family protein
MASGRSLVERARRHIGEAYKFVAVPKDDPNWRGPWDCAEFISWLVYQEAGVLYGCDDDRGDPHKADAWTGYWKRDVERGGIRAAVEKAAATVGGILLRYPPDVPGKYGHIVLSDGRGGTIEAMGRAFGVRAGKVAGRTWHAGILLPEIAYDVSDGTVEVPGPAHLFAIDAPNVNPLIVSEIQQALKAKGFDPGPIDGAFGQKTMEAVVAFQDAQGLVVDGEVGETTAGLLGVDLAAPAPEIAVAESGVSNVTDLGRKEAMGPLIPIALQLLPGLINLIAGDKSGTIQASITKAVSDFAGTTDSVAARQKIDSDPAIATQLQLKLAQIAADEEDKRNQAQLAALKSQQDAQLAVLKAQQDQEASRRRDELEQFKASLQETDVARSRAYDALKAGGPAAWAPIAISLIVTLGFFGIFIFLVTNSGALDQNKGTFQLVNLTLGALVAAFTTVVTFWLGSSQGSRIKDVANADMQAAQAQERNDTIKSQAETIQKTQSTSLEAARQAAIAENKPQPAAAKRSNFQKCVDIVLSQEGGFSNRDDDPGGPTNLGVTLNTLNAWLKERGEPAATIDDLKNLTPVDAAEIYRTNYWNVLRCEDLPAGVDLVMFDFGVNAGPGRAAKILQTVVGAASDGSVGSATIAAVKAERPQDVIARVSQQRLDFYRQLPGFARFGTGWTNRTSQISSAALAMADAEGEAVA